MVEREGKERREGERKEGIAELSIRISIFGRIQG